MMAKPKIYRKHYYIGNEDIVIYIASESLSLISPLMKDIKGVIAEVSENEIKSLEEKYLNPYQEYLKDKKNIIIITSCNSERYIINQTAYNYITGAIKKLVSNDNVYLIFDISIQEGYFIEEQKNLTELAQNLQPDNNIMGFYNSLFLQDVIITNQRIVNQTDIEELLVLDCIFMKQFSFMLNDIKGVSNIANSIFNGATKIDRTFFEAELIIDNCIFNEETSFISIKCKDKVEFKRIEFNGNTSFEGATLQEKLYFTEVSFNHLFNFKGISENIGFFNIKLNNEYIYDINISGYRKYIENKINSPFSFKTIIKKRLEIRNKKIEAQPFYDQMIIASAFLENIFEKQNQKFEASK